MTVDPDRRQCHCGSHGAGKNQGRPRSASSTVRAATPTVVVQRSADLLEAAERGESGALAAMAESGRWLGIGIAGLVNVFKSSRVALGGLYARINPYARQALEHELGRRAIPRLARMVELTTASLGATRFCLAPRARAGAQFSHPAIVPLSGDATVIISRRRAVHLVRLDIGAGEARR